MELLQISYEFPGKDGLVAKMTKWKKHSKSYRLYLWKQEICR